MAKFNLKQLKKDIKKEALKRRTAKRITTKKSSTFPTMRKRRGGCNCGG